VDLTNKGWAVFGPRGSGKSWFLKHVLDSTPDHWLYDPLHEHKGYRAYLPDDSESIPELEEFMQLMVIPKNGRVAGVTASGKPSPALFVIDEANRYVKPKPAPLPKAVGQMVDFCRHFEISFGVVARRPVQFHTDLIELADAVFFYQLDGVNNHKYLQDLKAGLGDQVRELPKHHFISLIGGVVQVHAPVLEPVHASHTKT